MIPYGTEITSARFAVPILRRLVASRIANVKVEPKFKKRVIAVDPEVGFRALGSTFPGITSSMADRSPILPTRMLATWR